MKFYIKNINDYTRENEEDFLLLLDKEKKAEYSSATNENRKKSILFSQGFAKETIAEEFNLEKKSIVFSLTSSGKPYCKSHRHIHFSLSHSDNMIALATDDREVGIDIEKLRYADEKLVNRVCSKNEKELIFSSKDRDKTFTEIWTKKEAYLKAYGTGINRNLTEVDTTDKNLKFTTVYLENFIISVFSLD